MMELQVYWAVDKNLFPRLRIPLPRDLSQADRKCLAIPCKKELTQDRIWQGLFL